MLINLIKSFLMFLSNEIEPCMSEIIFVDVKKKFENNLRIFSTSSICGYISFICSLIFLSHLLLEIESLSPLLSIFKITPPDPISVRDTAVGPS